ncbi:TatD family hydrolase [Scopulibacillus cellulosilyticus]|uniref:TatD family hydrolase n=1 Tax=Scopulibacillus cellulosilyticus TaxID=2665665 RepID=A0ABW2PZ84_9BACL
MNKIIDSHIHLDQYNDKDIDSMIKQNSRNSVKALIAVSMNKASSERNLELAKKYPSVYPAFGYHPEQELPTENEIQELLDWMDGHCSEMAAVGEVGLPYYLRQEKKMNLAAYEELLEIFIQKSSEWQLPIVLHAVYEDAGLACDLLEKYSIKKAHFHWFKGDLKTIERLMDNGYYISFTPEVCYRPKIRQIAKIYPLELMMLETDGPWPFAGPFQGQKTSPVMIHKSAEEIAALKNCCLTDVYTTIWNNTCQFYNLSAE